VVYLLFFLSGMAGLIYEISWSRQLGIYFGHSVYAAAVVLAAYFAGMALGYLFAGRLCSRLRRPLAAYGWAELGVAAWAVATPFVLHWFSTPAMAALLNHPDPAQQIALRALVTFLALLPATLALGATLPFIAQHVSPPALPRPALITRAYAFNTAGAMTGVLAATGLLILLLGVTASSWLAAAISAACGLGALALSARAGGQPLSAPEPPAAEAPPEPEARPGQMEPSWYVLAALSGAGVLALQVLYVRMFALTFHNSTYTFGAIVAAFLAALAIGGFIVSRYSARLAARPWAALACVAGAALSALSVFVFQRFTHLGYFDLGNGFAGYMLSALALVAVVVMPPVIVLATILPYCWTRIRDTAHGPGSAVGRLTALNTVAATLGILATSFVLLPVIGLWKCFAVVAGLYLACGLVLLFSQGRLPRQLRLAATGLAALALVFAGLIQWPIAVVPNRAELRFARETPYGIISVLYQPERGELWLKQNNHYTLGATSGNDSELRQGSIPLLLHPAPREVCFLGLATGITAGSALMQPEVEDVVAVELIPEVVEAAELFDADNQAILRSPQAEIVVNDARHYLYATDREFDVIVSDLFVPWHSQTGYLYTVEHYRAARQRLRPGGLFCQWLPLYQLSEAEFTIIADSFATVFPSTTLWRGEVESRSPLMALVGSNGPLELDERALQRRLTAITNKHYVDPVLWSASALAALYEGDWQVVSPGYLNTDEHPRVEFLAPVSHRSRQALTKDELARFEDEVLSGLPRELVRIER
jgi:spermidine synthase